MEFQYFEGEQRSPEWFKIRLAKVTSSRLSDWLAVSKAKATAGQPLKARLDYEKELLFERVFGTSFETYVSEAMQDGIDYEDLARREYKRVKGVEVIPVGCWYNDYFVASPDGGISTDGIAEIKIVKDNSFTDLLTGSFDKSGEHIPALSENGLLSKWWKQVQGQLWASGKEWCDFIAVNFNTKKIKIVRIFPDVEFHKWVELTIVEEFTLDETIFDSSELYDLVELKEAEQPILTAEEATQDIKALGF
jgi:hypothetical protein